MAGTTPSTSLSLYRPAILVLTGAAAACTAYVIYSILQEPHPAEGLRRSNAVRRPNPRQRPRTRPRLTPTARLVQHLQNNAHPLGEFEFFGNIITLDTSRLLSSTELLEIAIQSQPIVNPQVVEDQIRQLYDTFLDRLLVGAFPRRALTTAETNAIRQWIGPFVSHDGIFSNDTIVTQALERHQTRFALEQNSGAPAIDGAESIAPTEMSWGSDESEDDGFDVDGQTLQRTLYHIAEDRARQEGVVHRGITCNGCDTKPIRGIRWRCANCADFDLCADCEATDSHIKTHIFYKIRVPAPYLGLPKQEPIYPGRPHLMTKSINSAIKKRLVAETKMETEEIEALWDQFTCLAGAEWEDDPNKIGFALDRRAFNHAFVPRYTSFISAPNLIYDRIFAYYDTDHNGLIGFEEFIKGLDGMHSGDLKVKLKILFNGYDVDGDGYVSRKDVLRIFRAYYAIEKEATRNYLAEASEELSVRGALETIHSSQPLGSAFTQNGIPARNQENERLRSKPNDEYANQQPPILYEDPFDAPPDTEGREEMLRQIERARILDGFRPGEENQALRDRWARRRYYIDEEEGFNQPEGADDDALADEENNIGESVTHTPEHQRPRWSRSSSRVRFQDDVDVETRSNASTSSRPFGERWGGYEIPEPEKDLGKEVLYQITQQAFNELLNPLFQEKEDNAMDAYETRPERRKCTAQIDEALEEFDRERDINRTVLTLGIFRYSKWVMDGVTRSTGVMKELLEGIKNSQLGENDIRDKLRDVFSKAEQQITNDSKSWDDDWNPDGLPMWNAKLFRLQLRQEMIDGFMDIVYQFQWLAHPMPYRRVQSENFPVVNATEVGHESPSRDPTMPQFRPNSLADMLSDPELDQFGEMPTSESPTASDTSSGRIIPIYRDDGFTIVHFAQPDGPFFVVPAPRWNDDSWETGPLEGQDGEVEVEFAPDYPPIPLPQLQDENVEQQQQSPESTTTFTNQAALFQLWIDPETMTLHAEPRAVSHCHPYDKEASSAKHLERNVRRAAMRKDSVLHIPMLASLEAVVEKEISDRKGSGMLNFEEFQECMEQGKLRFLESWMDWVSY